LLAERFGAPVITTCNGKGVLAEDHPLSIGTAIRLPAAQRFIAGADVTLVVGSELGDSDLWGGTIDSPTVIRLDADPGQLDKNRAGQAHLLGDAAAGLRLIVDARCDPSVRWFPGGSASTMSRRPAAASPSRCA
jgi:thiamine pyrophosphate-dependent acetolactate synthase large subunit-like protein